MGLLPQTPPKGTFCKKSPLESRKTAFDFYYLLGFYLFAPKVSKGRRTCLLFAFGVTSLTYKIAIGDSRYACSAHREFNPQNKAIGPLTKCYIALSEINPQSQSSVASNYQTGFCSQGIKRPAYMSPAFDGL